MQIAIKLNEERYAISYFREKIWTSYNIECREIKANQIMLGEQNGESWPVVIN